MKTILQIVILFCLVVMTTSVFAQDFLSGKSVECGLIGGKTQQDLKTLTTFCEKVIPEGSVVSAAAVREMLWLEVDLATANDMRAHQLEAKRLVLNWMRAWKSFTGERSVVVSVLWGEIEIAKGDTTIFSGDVATIH